MTKWSLWQLYCLFDYPNSFLTMNLLGNSPLLNVLFLCYCLAISSISCWYSFSNSLIAPCVFFKFSLPSQVLDSTVNPFQHTRYLSFPLTHCLFNILSTSYSFSLSIMIKASCFFFCPSICPTYRHILLMLTTRCIFTIVMRAPERKKLPAHLNT